MGITQYKRFKYGSDLADFLQEQENTFKNVRVIAITTDVFHHLWYKIGLNKQSQSKGKEQSK